MRNVLDGWFTLWVRGLSDVELRELFDEAGMTRALSPTLDAKIEGDSQRVQWAAWLVAVLAGLMLVAVAALVGLLLGS